AAVIVEVHPRQGAAVGEARGVELEQQVAVFGVDVVVPAQPVGAEGGERDGGDGSESCERDAGSDAGRRRGFGGPGAASGELQAMSLPRRTSWRRIPN